MSAVAVWTEVWLHGDGTGVGVRAMEGDALARGTCARGSRKRPGATRPPAFNRECQRSIGLGLVDRTKQLGRETPPGRVRQIVVRQTAATELRSGRSQDVRWD